MNEQRRHDPVADGELPDAGPARGRIPLDTATAPHEPVVEPASTVGMWFVVLSGPALWIGHFFGVYLLAEASCRAEATGRMSFVGSGGVTAAVVVVTIVALASTFVGGRVARRRAARSEARDMYRIGMLLSGLSSLAILLVAVPIAVLPVCG